MKKKEESAAAKSKTSTRKRKEAEPADGGTGAEVEIEPENVKKPTTRGRKKKVQEKVEETQPESGEAAPSEKASKSDLGEKPKAKAKSKVKEKAEPKKEAKAKRAAKAKAKRLPKKAVKDDESGDEEETDAQKLRKKLFQSDDDGSDESEHERYDAKTGKVEPLKDILEKCEVDKHKAKNRKLGEPEPEESTPKKAKGGKNKNKTKVKKVDLSPFTKKEVSRRKRKEKETMHQEAKEDEQIQGIVRQHLKNVEKLTYEDVKLYLRKHLTNSKPHEFKLNEYWGRPACGIKVPALGDGSLKKAPEVVYIGRYGTCAEGWNYNMACVYVTASLMASWFDPYILGKHETCSAFPIIVAAVASFRFQSTQGWPACVSFCRGRILILLHWTFSLWFQDLYVTAFFWMIFPCTVLLATSKASWLEDLPAEDLEDYANPTGKVQTHLFFMKYNVSVAAALFATALKKKWWFHNPGSSTNHMGWEVPLETL